MSACPDEGELLAYLGGGSKLEREPAIRAHVDTCDACRELLTELVRLGVTPEPDEDLLARGTSVGRYVVLDLLGRGGVGVVYSAFDPELDRKVAIKLFRDGGDLEGPDDASSARGGSRRAAMMLAEAQMLARLSHPAVVTIHDVGRFGDEIFFAMELIKGQTLREAVAAEPSRWRRTLGLYLAAGVGLSAAHRASLVHRDFKPDNALVDEEGRVRVMDFGLASAAGAPGAGGALGTFRYMAPEQRRGEALDARADQFSFCAALLEGLHASTGNRIPPAVDAVLAKGMSAASSERFPSMDALLAALSRAARRVSPRETALLAALVLLAALSWTQRLMEARSERREVRDTAERVAADLSARQALVAIRVGVALRSETVLNALDQASNQDAALGLAPEGTEDRGLALAHDVLRSADLPNLKDADALLFLNGSGRVVFNGARETEHGGAVPPVPLVVKALSGETGNELWSDARIAALGVPLTRAHPPGDLLWVTASPTIHGTAVTGVALTGVWVRARLPPLPEGFSVSLQTADGAWLGTPVSARPRVLVHAVAMPDVHSRLLVSRAARSRVELLPWMLSALTLAAVARVIRQVLRFA